MSSLASDSGHSCSHSCLQRRRASETRCSLGGWVLTTSQTKLQHAGAKRGQGRERTDMAVETRCRGVWASPCHHRGPWQVTKSFQLEDQGTGLCWGLYGPGLPSLQPCMGCAAASLSLWQEEPDPGHCDPSVLQPSLLQPQRVQATDPELCGYFLHWRMPIRGQNKRKEHNQIPRQPTCQQMTMPLK